MLAAMRRVTVALSLLALAWPMAANAQEDGELRLMAEPHSWVDVADAFDDDDPFDLNVRVGYRNVYQFGNIQRENPIDAGDAARMTGNWTDVAHHTHTRNILDVGLDVGIFRDLALIGRMPIILSDDRSLTANGETSLLSPYSDIDPAPMIPGGDQALFNLPFDSPTRSGLDYIEVGLAWSIFNQNRERELPTWVLMVSGRLNVGDPMIACQGGSGTRCREWTNSGNDWTFDDDATDDAGETRGTNGLRIETRASWRTRYVEPYGGLLFGIEWPGTSERFFLPANNINGFINEQPPIMGQLTGGMAIIPWEDRGGWQRFSLDVRFQGRYLSEGHGYSPLFDALGTSNSPYLTSLNVEGAPRLIDPDDPSQGSVLDPNLRRVPFFGLTDMQQRAELGAYFAVEMRAARFVSFQLSAQLWYVTPYIITFADACNPNVDGVDRSDPRSGTCRSGIINPHFRSVLDSVGRSFRVDEQIRSEITFKVTGMF